MNFFIQNLLFSIFGMLICTAFHRIFKTSMQKIPRVIEMLQPCFVLGNNEYTYFIKRV